MRLHGSVQGERTAIDFKPFLQVPLAPRRLPEEKGIQVSVSAPPEKIQMFTAICDRKKEEEVNRL